MRRYTEAEIREMVRDEFNSTAMYNPKMGPGLPHPFGVVPSPGIWTIKLDRSPSIEEILKQTRPHKVEKIKCQDPILNTERSLEEILRRISDCSAEEMEQQFEDQIDVLLSQFASEEVPEEYKGPIRQTLEGIVGLLDIMGRPDLVRRVKTAMMTTQLGSFEKTISEGSEALKHVLDGFVGDAQGSSSVLESFKQELADAKFTDEEVETVISVIDTERDEITSLEVNIIENVTLQTSVTTQWGSQETINLSGDFFVVEAKTTDGECDTNVFSRYTKACDAKVKLFKLNRERKALMEHI